MELLIGITLTQALAYGLVQGLGEFLPISSSAHLVILPWLLNWNDPGLAFDVALHFGTLLAVLIYFRKDWFLILKMLPHLFKKESFSASFSQTEEIPSKKLLLFLIVATLPGAGIGFALQDYAESLFRSPLLIAGTMSLLGVLLYLVDRYGNKKLKLSTLTFKQVLTIGLAQSFAIIPGVSRSGSTITAGLALGLTRQSAARFSFLMSAPIIAGATLLKWRGILIAFQSPVGILAIATSFLSGLLAIGFLMKWVGRSDYKIFSVYRLGFSLMILVRLWTLT